MCVTPIRIKVKGSGNKYRIVPCAKCPKCKQRHVDGWVLRIMQQDKLHKKSVFLTLTYNNESVPITAKGFMSLQKQDFQKFVKRLRKRTGCKTIKYYACGEYGTNTWRPHYHAIMFDVSHEDIAACWTLGNIDVRQVNSNTIAYTLKYVSKEARVPLHANDDRKPEFSLMSKNMGLNYLSPQMVKWHKENEASYVVLEGGYTKSLPRYYRDKIFSEEERELLNIRNQSIHKESHEAAVAAAGSITEFYRGRYYAVKQYIENVNNNNKLKRSKL